MLLIQNCRIVNAVKSIDVDRFGIPDLSACVAPDNVKPDNVTKKFEPDYFLNKTVFICNHNSEYFPDDALSGSKPLSAYAEEVLQICFTAKQTVS